MVSKVTRASSATGMSVVPAEITSTLPFPRIEIQPNRNGPRKRMEFRFRRKLTNSPEELLVAACNQNIVTTRQHAAHHAFHLLRLLATAKDHFREPLPQRPVMVDFRVPQVFIGQVTKLFHGVIHAERATTHLLQ